jgi:hypothetical protein
MQTTEQGFAEAEVAGFGRGELPRPRCRRPDAPGPLPVAAASERAARA